MKAQNCTFIHDEEYAGQPTPSMLKFNRGMNVSQYNEQQQQPLMNMYPPQNMPGFPAPPSFYPERKNIDQK